MTKILVIDDKKDDLISVIALMKNLEPEYEVLTAQSGIEGIKLAKSKQPDTILLDVHLPKMDGYEVCRRLRADKKTDQIPIIYLTAVKTSPEDRIRGLELGGDAYLTKPIDEGELLAILHTMLRIKKAEDELLYQYKNIVSSSIDMMALLDKNFIYLATNQAYLDAFKKTSDEMVGHKVSEIFGEEFFKTVIKPHAKRCLAGETVNYQVWLDFPAYKNRFMDITYYPYIGENNKVEGFVVNGRNITKRKRVEEALHKSKANLVAAQRIAHIGSWEWDVLEDTAVWSDETYRIFGIELRELEEHRQNFLDRVHPDDRARVAQALSNAINGTKDYDLEYRIVLPDKKEKVIHARAEVVCDDAGKTILMRGTVHDITERKLAEKALRESEEKYRGIFDESVAAIYVFDTHKNFIDSNQAGLDLLGYSREELLKMSIPQVDVDPETVLPGHKQLLTGDRIVNYEHKLKRKDGSVITVLNNSRPLIDISGNVVGIQSTLIDVTERKQAEEALRASQEYSQNLIDSSLDMIIAVDMKRRITEFNRAAEETFGYKRDEVLGKHINLLYADAKQGSKVHKTTVEKGRYIQEILNKRKNGKIFPALLASATLVNIDGELIGVMGVSRDITEHKRTEGALKESEERYRGLVNTAPLGIAIHQEGNWVLANQHTLKMLGYEKEEELLGRKALDILDPDHRELAAQRVAEMAQTGNPSPPTEVKVLKKDGSVVDALITSVPIAFNGKPAFEVAAIDISVLKQAKEAVKESETKFRTLFEDSRDAVYIAPLKGSLVDFNQSMERMLGYSRDELFTLPPVEHYAKKEDRLYFIQQIESQGYVEDYELQIQKKDGTFIDCVETASVRKDPQGNVIGYQGIIRDITESKRAQENLKEALEEAKQGERVKTLFLANMSHEIRTPLNAILGFTDLLEQNTSHLVSEEEKGFFDTIRTSGQRLLHTVHEILDISQIEAGTYDLKMEQLDLVKLGKNMLQEYQLLADKKGLELEYKSDLDSAFIKADQYGVSQAINNIIDNAIKYTEQGRITVSLENKSKQYVLSVQDTGIGISEEYRDNLFEAFSQESEGYTKKFQGIGLGMAIAKRHLDLNKIGIDVDSTKGVGTTFTLFFKPAKKRSSKKQVKEEAQLTATTESIKKPLVLSVEDDSISQKLTEYFLKGTYNVCYAVSVNEAKQQLKKCPIDLILLDLSLVGNEDGLDLVRWMRRTKTWKKTPVIATTAHAFTTDLDNCLAAGCNDYMAKPIKREKLLEKISELV